jgi:hypothetical protein
MGITISRREVRSDTELEVVEHFGLDPAGVEARCFSCGAVVRHPAIYWAGAEGTMVYLHGDCAAHLALALTYDAIRLKHLQREQPAGAAL